MNVSVWYPLNYFTDPNGVNQTVAMFQTMVRLDSVFVPAGDGGEVLAPLDMLAVMEQQAGYLREYHPTATSWTNAQQYSQANFTALMAALDLPVQNMSLFYFCVRCGLLTKHSVVTSSAAWAKSVFWSARYD